MQTKLQVDLTSYPLPDLIHVLGEDVVHVPQVRSEERLLGLGRALLLLAKRTNGNRNLEDAAGTEQTHGRSNTNG